MKLNEFLRAVLSLQAFIFTISCASQSQTFEQQSLSKPIKAGDETNDKQAHSDEKVILRYSLVFDVCGKGACHKEFGPEGQVTLLLEHEDDTFSWTFRTVDIEARNLAYQLRFKVAKSILPEGKIRRNVQVGFSGRATVNNESVQKSWGEKTENIEKWVDLAGLEVKGSPYSEGRASIIPTLRIETESE